MKIATLQLLFSLALIFSVGCAPSRPKTNTPAPSLGTAKILASRLGKDINDYKGNVRRVRTLSEQIEYKASLID